jgi:acyl-CoA synthetase (NDP forming)
MKVDVTWHQRRRSEHDVTRRFGKRLLASAMLLSIAAAAVMPLPSHERTTLADCHQSASSAAAVSANASQATECDHSAGTACATMLGCVVLPSALASAATRFSAQATVAVVAPSVNAALHGRLALGPPTPPPNS